MLSVREELVQYLKEQTGLEVYYYSPPVNVAISMPILILEEVDNSDYFYREHEDGTETEITSVVYEISIYSNNPSDLFIYAPIIDKAMKRHGFKKSYTSGDNHVEPLYCRTLRFTGKIQLKTDTYYVYQ